MCIRDRFYSGVDEKSRAARGVAVFIDKRWQQGIQEHHFESERILYLKITNMDVVI